MEKNYQFVSDPPTSQLLFSQRPRFELEWQLHTKWTNRSVYFDNCITAAEVNIYAKTAHSQWRNF